MTDTPIPGDWRRPSCPDSWSMAACGAGCIRLEPMPASFADTLPYYRPDPGSPGYCTRGADPIADGRETALDRLRVRVAWRFDRRTESRADWICRHTPAGVHVLDVGCGPGDLLARLRDRGIIPTGIEPDAIPRDAARLCGLAVHDGTAEDIPPPLRSRRFDAVVLTHALNVCLDPAKALSGLAGLLSDGGRLFIEVPNGGSLEARWYGLAGMHRDAPRTTHEWTAAGLRRLVESVGLAVEEVSWCGYTRMFTAAAVRRARQKWEFFRARADPDSLPAEPTPAGRWLLLARTAFAPPPRKYDSIRFVATRRKP